jgi:toxin-antitoxin system PIN domain toxin
MIALDTNILVQAHQREADLHQEAKNALKSLAESPAPWGICFHSLIEFYGVVTHSRIWKKASSPQQAINQMTAWRESPSLRILIDNESTLDQFTALAHQAKIRGGQAHDARIAACCLTYAVTELWTLDRDFSRYPALKVRNPLIA